MIIQHALTPLRAYIRLLQTLSTSYPHLTWQTAAPGQNPANQTGMYSYRPSSASHSDSKSSPHTKVGLLEVLKQTHDGASASPFKFTRSPQTVYLKAGGAYHRLVGYPSQKSPGHCQYWNTTAEELQSLSQSLQASHSVGQARWRSNGTQLVGLLYTVPVAWQDRRESTVAANARFVSSEPFLPTPRLLTCTIWKPQTSRT